MKPALTLVQIGEVGDIAALARLAEQVGYTRFWCTEHYGHGRSGSPLVAAAFAAAATESIRIGTAAVLLAHRSPLKVASDAALLAYQSSGRFDLGVAGATAADTIATDLLEAPEPFERATEALAALVIGSDERSAWAGPPGPIPELWVCGSGSRSAEVAAAIGAGLAHGPIGPSTAAVLEQYRSRFRRGRFDEPRVSLLLRGYCAGSGGEAEDWWRRITEAGAGIAADFLGDPATCRTQLVTVADRFGADEIALAHVGPGVEANTHSAALVGKAFDV